MDLAAYAVANGTHTHSLPWLPTGGVTNSKLDGTLFEGGWGNTTTFALIPTVIVKEFEFPAASVAIAVKVGEVPEYDDAFQVKLYGALFNVPCEDPFTLRLTEVTPTLSLALTDTEIVAASIV
jgi:hypothetical protein